MAQADSTGITMWYPAELQTFINIKNGCENSKEFLHPFHFFPHAMLKLLV